MAVRIARHCSSAPHEIGLAFSDWINQLIRKAEQPGFPIPNLCQVFDRYDCFGPEKWSQVDLVEHLLEFPLAMMWPTNHNKPWLSLVIPGYHCPRKTNRQTCRFSLVFFLPCQLCHKKHISFKFLYSIVSICKNIDIYEGSPYYTKYLIERAMAMANSVIEKTSA